MSDLKIYDDYNTLPEQVQLNKDDIKKLSDLLSTQSEQIQSLITTIANLGWELKTDDVGNKWYIPKGFDENIPYSLTNTTDLNAVSGLNIYKDSDGYVATALTTYIPEDDNYVGIATGHIDDGYFCNLSMQAVEDKAFINNVSYIATSSSPQLVENKKNFTIATMGWINKYYLSKSDASNTYATKLEHEANQADIVKLTKRVDSLDMASIDVPLTASGLEKIQVNPTIGTPIKLIKNTDFDTEIAQYDDDTESIAFSLYKDSDEEVYIAFNIKLNVQKTTNYYADNDQPYIWWTGVGVIKLGNPTADGNQYLCHIAYSDTYDNGLVIIPISKLV